MLLELLSLAINSRETSQEKDAYVAARSNSWKQIILLKNDAKEVAALVRTLSHVTGAVLLRQAPDWKKQLDALPQHVHFGNHTICYRHPVESGVVLLAECIIGADTVNRNAPADTQPDILNASFFLTENMGKLELRCKPTDNEVLKSVIDSFSARFLGDVLKTGSAASVAYTGAEEKRSWWKKLLGS